jgi:hypothetical protein
MKKSFQLMFAAALTLTLIFAACKKKEDNVSETVKVQYPRITLKGAKYVTINLNDAFSDPGATMFDTFTNATTDLAPTKSGVDNTKPGMYPIIYEGTNKYGFKSQEVRWVAVTPVSASEDIGGTYKRTSNGQPITVTKVSRGIYKCDNMGGVAGSPDYIFDTYFVQLSDTTVNYPEQPGPFGTVKSSSEVLKKSGSDTTLKWIVLGAGFGTAARTFSHQ